jgi:hypothetical protein
MKILIIIECEWLQIHYILMLLKLFKMWTETLLSTIKVIIHKT